MHSDLTIPTSGMLIDGELVDASDGSVLEAYDPSTEAIIGRVPDATADDVNRAVAAARRASVEWANTPWTARAKKLHEFADLLDANRDELAELDARDAGLPVASMRADVTSAASEVRYFAGVAGETKGGTIPSGPDAVTYTEFTPYPVVARIVPFNHPIKFISGKSAAALAAGAPVIAKPGEQSSMSALRLAELVKDLFPAGVLNIVTGSGAKAGAALSTHPDIPRVAFTGSVPTGSRIMAAGAETIKHVSLELGGKNPMVIFPDADPEKAGAAAVGAMNIARSMGQSCGSTSRIFVHTSIKERFVAALVRRLGELRVGDPLEDSTDVGPVAFERHYERVMGYIAAGVDEGATLAHGGGRPQGLDRGFFVEPTAFTDVTMDMTIAREEIFGPVISVLDWENYDEMLEEINHPDLGLTGNIWTRDISTALRMARQIDSGYITVNGTGKRPLGAPFGGFRHSGIGKEGSLDELLSYGRMKSITINL